MLTIVAYSGERVNMEVNFAYIVPQIYGYCNHLKTVSGPKSLTCLINTSFTINNLLKKATLMLCSYGYNGHKGRSNLYLLPTGEIIYFIAEVVVLYNVEEQMQRHYLGHTDDVKWWVLDVFWLYNFKPFGPHNSQELFLSSPLQILPTFQDVNLVKN